MAYYRDFREFLQTLEKAGKLRRISDPIDKDRELHPLVKWQYRGINQEERFGFLFEHVLDRNGRRCAGQTACSVIAANRDVYAISFACQQEEIHDRWARGYSNPISPRLVSTGPVKEEIHTAETLVAHDGLREFGIPFATNGWEAFPRITAGAFFSRDPETGVLNAGMYNSIVLGPLRANLRTGRHLRTHWNKARAQGKPLEVAIAIGAVPVVPLVAATDVPPGVYELDVAGGIIGEPIEVVRCETVDLQVPAHAEVVIEGFIPTDRFDKDGPSGENRGHVMPGSWVHAVEVTGITHRRNPIWHDIICQLPPSESSEMRSVNCEGLVLETLRRTPGLRSVKDVAFHNCGSARHFCVVRLHDLGENRGPNSGVWQVLETIMSVAAGWPKIAIAVDEDIDPRDLETVFWALTVRHQPHRDIRIVARPSRGGGMDESVAPRDTPEEELASYQSSYLLIDATRKWDNPPISLPRRDYMERARILWEKMELPPLKPREPWHGMSLGFWPDEEADLVALSEQGREDEAAQILLSRGRQLEGRDPIRGMGV